MPPRYRPPPPNLTRAHERALHVQVGARLRALRESHGYTLVEAGELVGVCSQSVYRHEHGRTAPSLPILHRFALVYGVSVAAIVDPDNAREHAA